MSSPVELDQGTLDYIAGSDPSTTGTNGISIEKDYDNVGYPETEQSGFLAWWEVNGIYIFGLASILFILFLMICIWQICRRGKDRKTIHEDSSTNQGPHGHVVGFNHHASHHQQQAFHDDHHSDPHGYI
mmetsp:Transcript_14941/g.13416  ORF Transcript_14941/g.13416 Transcript_14941/m.13416 type:complete len:129 (+) Transcript_14941:38-424(+)